MSGCGRRTHYRKSVTNEVFNSFPIPEPGRDSIACIVGSRGTNIFEIELPDNNRHASNNSQATHCGDTLNLSGDNVKSGGQPLVLHQLHNNSGNEIELASERVNDEFEKNSSISSKQPCETSPDTSSVATTTTSGAPATVGIIAVELAMMPSKFKRLIWIKRGDFVIVTTGIHEATTDSAADGACSTLTPQGKKSPVPSSSNSDGIVGVNNRTNKKKVKGKKWKSGGEKNTNRTSVDANTSIFGFTDTTAKDAAADPGSETVSSSLETQPHNSAAHNKVHYMIKHILTNEQIMHLYKEGLWPDDAAASATAGDNHGDNNSSHCSTNSGSRNSKNSCFDVRSMLRLDKLATQAYTDSDIMPQQEQGDEQDEEEEESVSGEDWGGIDEVQELQQ